MIQKVITLRCNDEQEAAVFHRYDYEHIDTYYELAFEDSYVGGKYTGFFGRLKRAWRAFIDKPVTYTGICCSDENKMRQFLFDCLELMDDLDGVDDNRFLQGLYTEE